MEAVREWWNEYERQSAVCAEIGCDPPRIPWEHAVWGPIDPAPAMTEGESWDDIGTMMEEGESIDASPEDSAQLGLDPFQERVVLHRSGPAVVMAGAGSGKTRTIVARVEAMIEEGIDPSSILCLTFTKKAAQEMKHRVERAVGARAKPLHVSTFHSLALDLLRSYPAIAGREVGFSVWDESIQESEVKSLVLQHPLATRNDGDKPIPWVNHKEIVHALDKLKEEYEDIPSEQYYESLNSIHDRAEEVARQYEQLKVACNALDFADMVWLVAKKLLTHPELGSSVRDRWSYVIVDEYQDTNRVQERMLALLTSEHHNLMVVGDEDQAIYSFRGSNVMFIRSFVSQYPTARSYTLGRNYRSTPQIVEPANALISHNIERTYKRVWSESEDGPPVIVNRWDNPYWEASGIAKSILQLREEGVTLEQMAVLVRTRTQFIPIEMQLMQSGIEYYKVGDKPWYTRRDAKTILAWMRACMNSRDLDAGSIVIQSWPGLGSYVVKTWREGVVKHTGPMLSNIGWLHAQNKLGRHTRLGKSLVALTDAWKQWEQEMQDTRRSLRSRVKGLIHTLEIDHEIAIDLVSQNTNTVREAEHRKDFITVMIDGLPDEIGSGSWDGMRKYLDAILTQTLREETVKGMCLTTIHSAKGLEWDYVWSPGWNSGKFPVVRAVTPEAIEEERRLGYVAVTRAKRQLTLSWFVKSSEAYGVEIHFPSNFLEQMDPAKARGPDDRPQDTPAPIVIPRPIEYIEPRDEEYGPYMAEPYTFTNRDACNSESASFGSLLEKDAHRVIVGVRVFGSGSDARCRGCHRVLSTAVVLMNTKTKKQGQLGQHCAARILGFRGKWFDAIAYAQATGMQITVIGGDNDLRGRFIQQTQPPKDIT